MNLYGQIVSTNFGGVDLELTVVSYDPIERPHEIWLIDRVGARYTFLKEPTEQKFKQLKPTGRSKPKAEIDKIIAGRLVGGRG